MSAKSKVPANIKAALEYGPLIIFVVLLQVWDIYIATAALMVLMPLVLGYFWLVDKELPRMPLITTVLVLAFGGLTLWFQDPVFVQLKVSIVNLLFAAVLGIGLIFNKLLIKFLMDSSVDMHDQGWKIMTYGSMATFLVAALVNEIIRLNFSVEVWGYYKFPGVVILVLVGMMITMVACSKHIIEPSKEESSAS